LANNSGITYPYCNLVGKAFAPCQNVFGITGAGNYPINFFQANPYAGGNSTGYATGIGYSTYESLQTELRQQQWRGLQLEANYTWSHSLGNGGGSNAGGGLNAASPIMTLHNLRLNYRPTAFDIHFADGGVTFQNGFTASKLQSEVGVHRVPQSALGGVPNYVLMYSPKILNSATLGGANTNYIRPNITPGTFGSIPYVYGPHGFYQAVSFSKAFPIFREAKVKFQAEISNIWNHPVFGNTGGIGDVGVQDTTFGQLAGPSNSPRAMDMRLNIEF
jgi:hypothetical protein